MPEPESEARDGQQVRGSRPREGVIDLGIDVSRWPRIRAEARGAVRSSSWVDQTVSGKMPEDRPEPACAGPLAPSGSRMIPAGLSTENPQARFPGFEGKAR